MYYKSQLFFIAEIFYHLSELLLGVCITKMSVIFYCRKFLVNYCLVYAHVHVLQNTAYNLVNLAMCMYP